MSVSYDPVKAHEYYLKHRELKGRKKGAVRSTKGFSQTQKEQWQFAQNQLQEEHRQNNKAISSDSKEKRAQMVNQVNLRIKNLRNQLKALSPEQRAATKASLDNMIKGIRANLKIDREALTEETKGKRANESEQYEKRKDLAYQHIKSGKAK